MHILEGQPVFFRSVDFIRLGHFRLFEVGGIIALIADDDGVFTGFGRNHKFMRILAADAARIGFDRTEF